MARPTPLTPPPARDVPHGEGRTLRIGTQIGRGSVATVYRGTVEGRFGLRRQVAVKVFDVIASEEHEAVLASLASAARRAACVRHPNVVRVEDFGVLGPAQPYVVAELLEGRTLARLLARLARCRERLALDLALFIGLEIAEGLEGARIAGSPEGTRMGVVHGELAASDVLLSWQGEVKVGDFGLGLATRAASCVRGVGSVTPRIRALSPEVARGKPGDARSDVFSLGVLLRELLVGPRFPALATDAQALAWARDGVVHQSMFEPQPPPMLRTVLTRSLERDPRRRYPHAGALATELRRAALSMGVGDGRSFLRSALVRVFGEDAGLDADETTGEVKAPRPSGVLDRFARLRGDVPMPLSLDDEDEDGTADGAATERPDALDSGIQLASGLAVEDDDVNDVGHGSHAPRASRA
jgi:serine/threonine protein kinase